jgi:hypothetical protein
MVGNPESSTITIHIAAKKESVEREDFVERGGKGVM